MMTYEEATQRISEMKSRYDDGFSSQDRTYLDSLYFALFGKEITNKGCSNCYRDAFIEISIKLKKIKTMPKKSEFILKAGAVITFFGEQKCYTNANMTDEAALRFLALNPNNERLFEKLPEGWRNRIESPESTTDVPSEAENEELIARLTAENEALKQELETLKASSGKKRKKKADAEAPEDSVPTSDAVAEDEQKPKSAPEADNEASVEDTDQPVVEE